MDKLLLNTIDAVNYTLNPLEGSPRGDGVYDKKAFAVTKVSEVSMISAYRIHWSRSAVYSSFLSADECIPGDTPTYLDQPYLELPASMVVRQPPIASGNNLLS